MFFYSTAVANAAAVVAAEALALAGTKILFVNRGDPAAYDKAIGDFNDDYDWHDWDLSSIIAAGAKLVWIRFHSVRSAVANRYFYIREKGNSNLINIKFYTAPVANANFDFNCLVVPDANGVIEYKMHSDYSICDAVVAGWFV